MTRDEDLSSGKIRNGIHAAFFRFGKDTQVRMTLDVFFSDFRMAGVRHIEIVIKTAEKLDRLGIGHAVLENAEHLLIEIVLRNAVVMV